ncbi:MAG: DNA gyrase inhibitor YacG [Candidatus Acidiferrales bacterium]
MFARWERGSTPSPRVVSMMYKCPICRKRTEKDANADFPFCSERCRLLDLGNWASERYVVSEPVIDEDELETPKEDNEPDR